MFFEQGGGLRPGAGADVVAVHIAVHVHIKAGIAAPWSARVGAAVTAAGLTQAVLAGLPGKILNPAQRNAVLGQTAGISRMVGKAAFPSGGEFVGFLKKCGHGMSPGHVGCERCASIIGGVGTTCQKGGSA